jgi:hypothetical protein
MFLSWFTLIIYHKFTVVKFEYIPRIIKDVTGKPDFIVDKYIDELGKIHDEIQKAGYFEDSYGYFIIIVLKLLFLGFIFQRY